MLSRGGLGLMHPHGAGAYAGFALALDFKNGVYRSGNTLVTDPSLLPGYSYARAGAKSEISQAGAPIAFGANAPGIVPGIGYWARSSQTNLLLNNAALSTQNVTVAAQAYTLSFFGTGTVTLSGTSTAGPLVGTGAGNQVALTFTPTAGTVTLTVTGSVTNAGLIAGLQPGPVIATAGATVTVAADDMRLTQPMPIDEDWIAYAAVNFQVAAGGAGEVPFLYNDGTTSNREGVFRINTGALVVLHSDSGTPQNPTSGISQAGAGRVVMLERRRSGKYTAAAKNAASTVSVGAESATTPFAIGLNRFDIGSQLVTLSANAPLEFFGFKRGTFSDAALSGLLATA